MQDTPRTKKPERSPSDQPRKIWPFASLVALAAVFSFVTAFTVVGTARLLGPEDSLPPELTLPLLLIAGLIALVVALAILVAAFHLFDLKDPTKPFGAPEGTLQVVIALSLILIFAITALYLRGSLNPENVTVRDLTAAQVDQIDGDTILDKIRDVDDDPETPGVDESRFTIVRVVPVDEDAADFSIQLLTILGTLVGAVAGFYFGAKSSETAFQTGASAGGSVAPTSTSPPLVGGNPVVGESLRTDDGGWTGSPAPRYGYQWQRKLPGATEWSNIPSANTASYDLTPADGGNTLRVVVTATNAAGSQIASSAESRVILQAPMPPASGIKLEIPAPRVEAQLEASHEEWQGIPTPSVTYQWERKRPEEAEWSPIGGEVAPTYTVRPDDAGYSIRIAATGSNEVGPRTAFSAESGLILQAPVPPAGGVVLEPVDTHLGVGAQLTATHEAWTGTPTPSVTYTWERKLPTEKETEWKLIEGEVAATYTVRPDDAGYAIRVAVRASNDAGDDVQHSEVTISSGT